MLHTKFQGHQLFGSGEEDFLMFLPYMGMAAILVMWPGLFEYTFVPPSQRSPYKFDFDWPSGFRGEDVAIYLSKMAATMVGSSNRWPFRNPQVKGHWFPAFSAPQLTFSMLQAQSCARGLYTWYHCRHFCAPKIPGGVPCLSALLKFIKYSRHINTIAQTTCAHD